MYTKDQLIGKVGQGDKPDLFIISREQCPKDKGRATGDKDGLIDYLDAPRVSEKSALTRLENMIKRSWGIIFFALVCLFIYEQGQRAIRIEYNSLLRKHNALIQQKEKALSERENMIRQINSQSDHDWVELTLMKGLGMVPENQIKVFFDSHGEVGAK